MANWRNKVYWVVQKINFVNSYEELFLTRKQAQAWINNHSCDVDGLYEIVAMDGFEASLKVKEDLVLGYSLAIQIDEDEAVRLMDELNLTEDELSEKLAKDYEATEEFKIRAKWLKMISM